MAGPVWRKIEHEDRVCDECLRTANVTFREGRVVDGELIEHRVLCETCYAANIRLIAHCA